MPRLAPLVRSEDRVRLAFVVGMAAAFHWGVGIAATRSIDLPHSVFGLFYDGHLYIEIARSFPLPFGIGSRDYMGQAPGYPALIALVRWLTPDVWIDWGTAALIAAVVPAALCAGMFYLLCVDLGVAALWPTALFVVANPRWVLVGAAPFPEPLAILFALASVRAALRGRPGVSMLLLSVAGLTRFPVFLLGAPLALFALPECWAGRREPRVALRSLWLALPPIAFGAYDLYLYSRLPDFAGIADAHSVFWGTRFAWPFESLWTGIHPAAWKSGLLYSTTYATAAFYLAAIALGIARLDRRLRLLPLCAAVIVLFHASLSGMTAAWAFGRLTIVAWPFALLAFACALPAWLRPAPAAIACVALGVFGVYFCWDRIPVAVSAQMRSQPFLFEKARRLQSDEPDWFDFRRKRLQRAPARFPAAPGSTR